MLCNIYLDQSVANTVVQAYRTWKLMEPLGLTVNHSSSTTTIIIIVIIIIIIIMIIQGVAKLSDEQLDEELRSSGLLWYAKLLLKHQAFVVELFDILLILEFCRCLYSINYSNYFAYFCYSYIVIIMHHMQRPVCAHTHTTCRQMVEESTYLPRPPELRRSGFFRAQKRRGFSMQCFFQVSFFIIWRATICIYIHIIIHVYLYVWYTSCNMECV